MVTPTEPPHSAEIDAPIVVNISTSQWLAQLAQAWDDGYSTCLGDFDIAARRDARSPNPHRVIPSETGER